MSTTNYGWSLPVPGGSAGVWGSILNGTFGDIDAQMKAVDDVAAAALPRAGGTMTGEILVHTDRHLTNNLGSMSGTVNLDLGEARVFYGTVAGATTLAFQNVPANEAVFVILEITNGGTDVTWPATVRWPFGTEPDLTASGVDVIVLYTRDGGTNWRAVRAMEDSG